MKGEIKAKLITVNISLLSLVASCTVLVWAICRLVRIKKSESVVNKVMISMHIVAYLFIIIIDFLTTYIPLADLRAAEIAIICNIAVYSVCNTIFGLIVN